MNNPGESFMRSAVCAVLATVCGAGLVVLAAPDASASPYEVTSDEVAWGDEYGQSMVCDVFATNPNTDGLAQVVTTVMDEGWDEMSAGRVIGYSMGTYCPQLLSAWVSATKDLG